MMQWAPVTTSGRRRAAICSVLLVAIACAALPSVSQASKRVSGPGYSTLVPNKWRVTKGVANGWRALIATAPSSKQSSTVGTMFLQVRVISTEDLTRQLRVRRLPSSPEDLLPLVADSPQSAQNISILASPRSITLRGVPAASGAASYVLGNTSILQSNIVCIRHRRVYLVQLYVDTTLQYAGTRALISANAHWRWR